MSILRLFAPTLIALLSAAACSDPGTLSDDDAADDDAASDDDASGNDDDDTTDDDTTDDDTGDDDTGDDDTGDDDVVPPDPADSGPLSITSFEAAGIDALVVRPDGGGPYPLITLLHGFQLSPDDYRSYADHLATWGYVVVLPRLGGSIFSPVTHSDAADMLIAAVDWAESAPEGLSGFVDTASWLAVGHSMGGKVSLLAATEDARVDAVYAIDPVDSGPPFGGNAEDYPSVAPERMDDLTVPIVLVGETTNAVAKGMAPACAPEGENFEAYYDAATGPTLKVDVLQASHMSFLDDPNCATCFLCPAGTDDPTETRALTRALLTAFAERTFRDAAWADAVLLGEGADPWEDLVDRDVRGGF